MNPLKQVGALLGKPVEAVSGAVTNALNRPAAESTPHAIARSLRGHPSLPDAVRDKLVLITGASSGIGEAAAIAIGAAGGTVLLVARGEEKLRATAAQVEAAGGTAHVHPCDLTDLEAIDKLVADVLGQHGRVDILVNNAGRSIRRSLALSYDRFHDYQRTMQLNYFAPVRLMLGVLPGMRERGFGQVINVSSVGVLTRAPRFGAYIASKAALDTLADAWQAETQDDNVRFTTVYMSLVRTPMIAPTTLYQKFPALTPEQAAGVITEAITDRPRRVSPAFGRFAFLADAITPEILDSVRNRGFKMFKDSKAATGQPAPAEDEQQLTASGKAFVEATQECTGEGDVAMSLPKPHPNADVVVTGASSGIGTELADGLARRGHNVVLVARRKDRLDELAERLRADHAVQVTVYARDLGTTAERDALVADLRAGGRTVSGICNCAGFGTSGQFKDLPLQRERDQVELNVVALLDLTHAFLGDMVAAGGGAVLNVASIAAFQPLPSMATYSASKAFVQTFSEAVHEELRGTGVSCTVLCPGPVETEWSEIASAEAVMIGPAKVSPRDVAEAAIAGMQGGKRSVVPGIVPKAMSVAGHFAPRTLLLPGLALGKRLRARR